MISVTEARQRITEQHRLLSSTKVSLLNSRGKVLSQDLYAPVALPPFRQSSVDGYALNMGDDVIHSFQLLKGESAAGNESAIVLKPGQALRIFTGAALPDGTDTVVMQEKTKIENNHLHINDPSLIKGNNVREKGSDLELNQLALPKGTVLNPAAIGLLASLGFTEVPVHRSPAVTILITGNELQQQGIPLTGSQVYESNSWSLSAALQQSGVTEINIERVPDQLEATITLLQDALVSSDIILITGGVSVGDYDYVVEATEKAGVKQIFHKVKQRPGKPLFFGTKEHVLVFGLPGNPSSALTGYYLYIAPLIASMQGLPNPVQTIKAQLTSDVTTPAGLTCFLKGYYENGKAEAFTGQESYKMKSYSVANCLLEIPEQVTTCNAGTELTVYLLPNH